MKSCLLLITACALLLPLAAQYRPQVIAHRGASGAAPENTLAAFRLALEQGADVIETDVHASADGVPVLLHDVTLERTSNGKGNLMDKSLSELRALDAGSWFGPAFAGEALPSLEDALKLINGKAIFLIEIKHGPKGMIYPGLEAAVADLIRRYDAVKWCIIQSFEPEVIDNMQRVAPELVCHKLIVSPRRYWPGYFDGKMRKGNPLDAQHVRAVNPNHRALYKAFIRQAHARKLEVHTWTVNSEADMQRCIELGVDGIITNYPDRLIRLLDDKRE